MVIADRVAVMNCGRIEQIGTPEDVYYRSKTDFVAQFIGLANVLDGEVLDASAPDLVKVRVDRLGELLARSNVTQRFAQAGAPAGAAGADGAHGYAEGRA